MQVKRVAFGRILEQRVQCIKMAGTSRCRNVVTSPCRDVSTSRRWINIYISQQAATSRRLNVATLQRRDVSTGSASQSLNAKRGPEFWGSDIGDRTNEGTEIRVAVTLILKKSL